MFHVFVKSETGHWKSGSSKNKTDMRVPLGGYALDQHNTHKSLDKKVARTHGLSQVVDKPEYFKMPLTRQMKVWPVVSLYHQIGHPGGAWRKIL